MNRICSECKKHTLRVRGLDLYNRMVCSNCQAQYELTNGQRWLIISIESFLITVGLPLSIVLWNWVAFLTLVLVLPISVHIAIVKICNPKLVGIKAMLHERNIGT